MRKAALLLFMVAILLAMASCGNQSQVASTPPSDPPPDPVAGNVPVGLTVTDTPPAGVTVLFFQLTITGATLTNSSGGSVTLLSSTNAVPVNVSQLQTDSAFLANQNVPAGRYTSLSVTFSNPTLMINNGTGAAIGSGAALGSCPIAEMCIGTVSISPLTLTFSSTPFPLTLSANSPLALKLDIHLNQVIQPDMSINLAAANGVTLTQSTPPSTGKPIPALGKLKGTIQSLGTSQFTLQTPYYRTFTILADSNTSYSYPSGICSAEAFSCLATGQVVNVQVSLQSDGSLLATEVDYIQASTQETFEGNIISLSTSGGNTIIELVMPEGGLANVTVPNSGVTYEVDTGRFVIPHGLTFAGVSDLRVGQEILVTPQGLVAFGPLPWVGPGWNSAYIDAAHFAANNLTLEPSQITGSVTTLNAGALNFIISTNPNYFMPPSTTAGTPPTPIPININVQTTGATTFTNLTPDTFSGLAVNDVVSVRGWLFPSAGAVPNICTGTGGCYPSTTVAAEAVVGRPGPTALF